MHLPQCWFSHAAAHISQEYYTAHIYSFLILSLKTKSLHILVNARFLAQKGMFNLIKSARALELPIDLQIELFDKMVKPVFYMAVKYEGLGMLRLLIEFF